MDFAEVVRFHGHVCPGLALGFRTAELAVKRMNLQRSDDEELVAIVENNSCAVDAIQMVTGCTFGKGNLIFRDYGKQVYTFIKRGSGESLRVAVKWQPPKEDEETSVAWKKYMAGNRDGDVCKIIKQSKANKVKFILSATFDDLFNEGDAQVSLPAKAQIYSTEICNQCGEKVMAPKIIACDDGKSRCIPCKEKK